MPACTGCRGCEASDRDGAARAGRAPRRGGAVGRGDAGRSDPAVPVVRIVLASLGARHRPGGARLPRGCPGVLADVPAGRSARSRARGIGVSGVIRVRRPDVRAGGRRLRLCARPSGPVGPGAHRMRTLALGAVPALAAGLAVWLLAGVGRSDRLPVAPCGPDAGSPRTFGASTFGAWTFEAWTFDPW